MFFPVAMLALEYTGVCIAAEAAMKKRTHLYHFGVSPYFEVECFWSICVIVSLGLSDLITD